MKHTEVIIFGIDGRLGSAIARHSGGEFTVAAGISDSVTAGFEIVTGVEPVSVYQAHAFPTELARGRTVIDASSPSGTEAAIALSVETRSPLVVATTGHEARQQNAIASAAENIPIVMDSNFSRGIAMLRSILPVLFPAPEGFDVTILERHRAEKKDFPSGTAKQLANEISAVCGDMHIKTEAGPRRRRDIEVVSIRAGSAPGSEHRLFLHDTFEELEFRHTVTDGRAYAAGIAHAVKWLNEEERQPGLYSMQDILTQSKA